ncbi:MAG TPA: hypothetical protein VFR15_13055 [Chloroflexia bacterium]|nr:hypothetical protein [Chloroflexia bacterium]
MWARVTPGRPKTILAYLVFADIALGLVGCGGTGAPAGTTGATDEAAQAQATATTLTQQPVTEPTAAAADDWITFTSEADGFSVDMPGEPQTSSQSMESALGELTFYFFQFTDSGTGAFYAVSYNDYPVDMTAEDLDPDSVLQNGLEATAQGSEVENVQRMEVQGYPAIEGEANLQESTHVWYRGILVNNRLYQLLMGAPQTRKIEYSNEARRLFESFTLLGQ